MEYLQKWMIKLTILNLFSPTTKRSDACHSFNSDLFYFRICLTIRNLVASMFIISALTSTKRNRLAPAFQLNRSFRTIVYN